MGQYLAAIFPMSPVSIEQEFPYVQCNREDSR